MDLKTGSGSIKSDVEDSIPADCSITVSDEDALLLFNGKLKPQKVKVDQ